MKMMMKMMMKMKMKMKAIFILLLLIEMSACQKHAIQELPIEVLQERGWSETLQVEGEIMAAASTVLTVPGTGWERRAIIEMVAEGSEVKKGQVLALFDAPQTRVQLSQAEMELLRKTLSEAAIAANAKVSLAELDADSKKVEDDLIISHRYDKADYSVFSKNKILDTLTDIEFLNKKHVYLDWKSGQVDARSNAQKAVVQSQRESVDATANQKRKSLSELALLAPHDGVFILKKGWSGSKPQVGGNLWSGEDLGSLPDLDKLIANFSVPEGQAFGLKTGLKVKLRLAGNGQELELIINKVSSSAGTKSRESPVKYSNFSAIISPELMSKYALKPGQAIQGLVQLTESKKAITVPNIALIQEATQYFVFSQVNGQFEKKAIELGVRGPTRSEVKSGIKVGDTIVLLPESVRSKT